MRVNMLMADDIIAKVDEKANELCITRTAYINMALARHFQDLETVSNMPELIGNLSVLLDKVERLQQSSSKSKK